VGRLSAAAVVGREAELAEIAELLDVTPAGARCLAFEGAPGIGETTLWRVAIAQAPQSGQARSDVQFTSGGPLSDEGNER
jgi:hypothetical protein